ncbi:hypothetical protein H3V53_36055 [Paraburkholderia bengalensis]|uniref:Uncharacterized protein n=1 Tax=Paraburkholderia bengalensis TaxID=2747562 RepID=A0ABU8J4A4_9BURK
MAAREPSLFRVAERAVVALYDGGVLSPAVLERVLSAFIGATVKWETEADMHSVDGRSFHDIVVATMMPGHAPDDVAREFARIIAHLESPGPRDDGPSNAAKAPTKRETRKDRRQRSGDEDETLIRQLGAANRPKRRRNAATVREDDAGPSSGSAPPTGFNPLVNARLPRKH